MDCLNPEHDASKCYIVPRDRGHTKQLGLKFVFIFLDTFMLKGVNPNFVFLDFKDITFDM